MILASKCRPSISFGTAFARCFALFQFEAEEGESVSTIPNSTPHFTPRRRTQLRMVRPSVLDLRFTGDPWIVEESEGRLLLCLGDYHLAGIRGLGIDLPSLNLALDRLRSRRPRPRRRA